MDNTPLVSFIIPYYNSGDTIQETIDSVLAQSYSHFDIWIVNDGSRDKASLDKLKELETHKKITILHQENAGPGIARNIAINKTDAEFILPLDADDKIRHDSVKNAINYFDKDKQIGVVYGDFARFGEVNQIVTLPEFDTIKQLLWNQIPVTALIKKQVFESCGYYDEFLSKPGLEDWEFWIRAGQSDWKIKKADFVFFDARYQNASRTFQVANKNLDLIRKHVVSKHANLYYKALEERNMKIKMLMQTPDYKIGNAVLFLYRKLKAVLGGQ